MIPMVFGHLSPSLAILSEFRVPLNTQGADSAITLCQTLTRIAGPLRPIVVGVDLYCGLPLS